MMPARTALLAPDESTLPELAAQIRTHHEAGAKHARDALDRWIAAGEALTMARARCDDGGWWAWVDANLPFTRETANLYIRVARYRDVLSAHPEPITDVVQARSLLRGLPPANPRGARSGSGTKRSERAALARKLRDDGLTYAAVADLMGVSSRTVMDWLDPDKARLRWERAERAKKRRREAAAALAARERDASIRKALVKAGSASREAHNMVSRLDQILGQAREEANSQAERSEIMRAHKARDEMMEHLIRALGVL